MKNKLWFRAKMYGWGWYPVSWQGWVIILLYVLALLKVGMYFNVWSHSGSDFLINFGFYFIILSIPLIIICYLKGEKPKWRWGR